MKMFIAARFVASRKMPDNNQQHQTLSSCHSTHDDNNERAGKDNE
jgi:hypothetical protein